MGWTAVSARDGTSRNDTAQNKESTPVGKWCLVLSVVVLASIEATASAAASPDSRRADTDRDGLSDRAEVRRYHTDPRRRDTDRDGLRDGAEVRRYHTDPRRR